MFCKFSCVQALFYIPHTSILILWICNREIVPIKKREFAIGRGIYVIKCFVHRSCENFFRKKYIWPKNGFLAAKVPKIIYLKSNLFRLKIINIFCVFKKKKFVFGFKNSTKFIREFKGEICFFLSQNLSRSKRTFFKEIRFTILQLFVQ